MKYTVIGCLVPSAADKVVSVTYCVEAASVQHSINKVLKLHKPHAIMVVAVFDGETDNLLDDSITVD